MKNGETVKVPISGDHYPGVTHARAEELKHGVLKDKYPLERVQINVVPWATAKEKKGRDYDAPIWAPFMTMLGEAYQETDLVREVGEKSTNAMYIPVATYRIIDDFLQSREYTKRGAEGGFQKNNSKDTVGLIDRYLAYIADGDLMITGMDEDQEVAIFMEWKHAVPNETPAELDALTIEHGKPDMVVASTGPDAVKHGSRIHEMVRDRIQEKKTDRDTVKGSIPVETARRVMDELAHTSPDSLLDFEYTPGFNHLTIFNWDTSTTTEMDMRGVVDNAKEKKHVFVKAGALRRIFNAFVESDSPLMQFAMFPGDAGSSMMSFPIYQPSTNGRYTEGEFTALLNDPVERIAEEIPSETR